jgi:PST family polysaccharide transporter
VAQFADLQAFVAGFVLLGAEQGLVAAATDAYSQGQSGRLHGALRAIRRRLVPPMLVVLAGLSFAAPWLIPTATGQEQHILPGALMIATLAAQLLVRPWQSVINGAKDFKLLARIRIGETLASLAVVAPLVLLWQVDGALYSLAGINLAVLAVNAWHVRRLPPPPGTVTGDDGSSVGLLVRFGAATLVTGLLATGLAIVVRRRIIENLGLDTAGLYQVAYALTQQYLGLVLGAMSAYSFPAFRTVHANLPELRREVASTLRGALLVIVPVIALLVTLRLPFIHLLFSRDYLAADAMLQVQLAGDLFKVIAWALGMPILASGRIGLHVALEVLLGSTWLLGVEVWTRWLGPLGPPLGFAGNQVLMCLVYGAIGRRLFGLRFDGALWRLLVASVALLALALALARMPLSVALAGTLVGVGLWAWLCVTRDEARSGLQFVLNRVRRGRGAA